jgi:glycerophosphoryl diester phosphodiesterase
MRLRGPLLAGLACTATTAPAYPAQQAAIVAHRGQSRDVPENTIAAFRQSLERGVAIIELDLRITKDGQLVVIHDEALDRTTNCSGRVSDMDLSGIKRCNAGGGERVPSFSEVLSFVRSKPVRILADVKDGTPLAPVIEEIRSHQAGRQLILGVRSTKHAARARAALPDSTILAYMPAIADAPAFATAGAHIIRLWSDWVEADPGLIVRTRALGPQVWIMVGHDLPTRKRDWRALHGRMIAAGAQGLITDRPDLISAP